jgi:hypothetical protein
MDKATKTKAWKELTKPFAKSVIKKSPKGFGDFVPHHIYTRRLVDSGLLKSFDTVEVIRGAEGHVISARCTLVVDSPEGEKTVTSCGDVEPSAINMFKNGKKSEGELIKDAESDAIKRCCMRLGIGLHLWEQDMSEEEYSASVSVDSKPTPKPEVKVEKKPAAKLSEEELKKMEDIASEMVAEPKEPTRVSDASPTKDSELELKDILFDLCGQEAAFARKTWDFTLAKVNLKKGFPKEFSDYNDDNEKTFIEEASKFIDKHRAEFKNRKANSQVINEVIEVFDGDVEVKEIKEGEEDMTDVPSGKWEGEAPSEKQIGILEEKIKDAIDAGNDELAAKAKTFLNSGEATKKNIFDWINTDGDWSLMDGS